MKIAWYEKPTKSAVPEPFDWTWEELVSVLSNWHFGAKDKAAGWAPHEVECTRKNENVRALSCLVLDGDHLSDDRCRDLFSKTDGFRRLIHTTASHVPGNNCVRIILPLARPVPSAEWRERRGAWIASMGLTGLVDDSTKDPARFYYVPTSPSKDAEREFEVAEGRMLDLLQEVPIVQPVPAATVSAALVKAADQEILGEVSLESIRRVLDSWGSAEPAKNRRARAIHDGEPWGDFGRRDAELTALIGQIVGRWPKISDEMIEHLIRPSVVATVARDRGRGSPEEDSVEHWVGRAFEKAQRKRPSAEAFHERIKSERAAARAAATVLSRHVAAAGGGWEPLLPFEEHELPPFPVEVLPEWARPFVSGVAISTQTPVDLGAMLFLTVCATALARKVSVMIKEDWIEPVNLYAVVVLPSGEGKSPVFRVISAPIFTFEAEEQARREPDRIQRTIERDIYKKALDKATVAAATDKAHSHSEAMGKGAHFKATDKAYSHSEAMRLALKLAALGELSKFRLLAEDCTPEKMPSMLAENDGRLAILSDEGGIFKTMAGRYQEGGIPNLEVFKKAHCGGDLRIDRVSRPSEHIERAALTFGVALQPDVVRKLSEKSELRGEGLLARFLYSWPRSRIGYRDFNAPPPSSELRVEYDRNVLALLRLPLGPTERILRLSADAAATLAQFRDWLEVRMRATGDLYPFRDWANKLTGQIARLAGLLHVSARPESWNAEVSTLTASHAIAIANYLIPHAKAAFGEMGADPGIDGAKRIAEWLKFSKNVTFGRREVHQAMRSQFRRATDLVAPLAVLQERGYIRACAPSEHPRVGRPPSERFEVRPGLWMQDQGAQADAPDSEDYENSVAGVSETDANPPRPSPAGDTLRTGADQSASSVGDRPTLASGRDAPSRHAPPKSAENGVPSAHSVQCRCCGNLVDQLPHPGCRNPGGWYENTVDGKNRLLRSPTGAIVAVVPLDAEGKPTSEDPSKEGAP